MDILIVMLQNEKYDRKINKLLTDLLTSFFDQLLIPTAMQNNCIINRDSDL